MGGKNYKTFIALILSVQADTFVLLIFESLFLYQSDWFVFKIVISDLICNVGISGFIGYLLILHSYLKVKGISTYEYVKNSRKSRYKEKLKSKTSIKPITICVTQENTRQKRRITYQSICKKVIEKHRSSTMVCGIEKEIDLELSVCK